MSREDFDFIERYLRERWAQEGEKNELDVERTIEYLEKLLDTEKSETL